MKSTRLVVGLLLAFLALALQGCGQENGKDSRTRATNNLSSASKDGFYECTDPAGKILKLHFDSPPSPADIKKKFDEYYFNETKAKAENGDVGAQRELGMDYQYGTGGVKKNIAESVKWYRKAAENARLAAERGDAHSQNILGLAYSNGDGVTQNDEDAFNWFSKAAEQGDSGGEENTGEAYRDGKGVAQSDAESVKWFQKSASQGNDLAQFNLGMMYELGRGVTQNSDEAMKWFQLSTNYSTPCFGVSFLEAYKGDIKAQSKIGRLFYYGEFYPYPKNHTEAAKWYRMAAEGGNAFSQYRLGSMNEDGDGVPKNMTEATKWYRMAADKGYAPAQGRLGMMYLTADGVERNYSEAFKLCSKAAEQNDETGLQGLTVCYDGGFGVPVDYVKAAEITRRLAESGDKDEQRNIAMDYEQGHGVRQDFIEAYKWYNLAAANEDVSTGKLLRKQGLKTASEMRGLLTQQMTPEQIAEGQRRAAAFVPHKETVGSRSDSSNTPENPTATGTGFFITDDGYLISNYHVVKGAAKVRLLTGAGLIDATVVKVDAANDLALLKANAEGRSQKAETYKPLPIAASRTVKLGGTVATVGFPATGMQGFSPKLAKGEIASLAGAADDPRYFQISLPVQHGNSGGALVDAHGNVVGIVAARLGVEIGKAVTSDELPENVNYAVKSSLLLSFLESVPDVSAKLKDPNTKDEAFEEVVKSAQDAAVLVLVY